MAFSLGDDGLALSSSEAAFLVCGFGFVFPFASFCGLAMGSLRVEEVLARVECAFGIFVDLTFRWWCD